jgi:membrane-associated HD superfamily phosphohydrolase
MNKRLTAMALAGTIGVGAVGAVAVAYPALADNNTSTPSATPSPGAAPDAAAAKERRIAAIKEALKSLVDNKTLTQAQADKVAETLAGAQGLRGFGPGGFPGPGRMGFGVDLDQMEQTAAKALGISVDDLRTQLRSGSTLADIAKKQKKDVDTLVNTLVQAARERLSQAVKDKKITQAMADQIDKNLKSQVQSFVENGRMMGRFRGPGGPGEWGFKHFMGPDRGQRQDGTPPAVPTPSATGQSSSFGSA